MAWINDYGPLITNLLIAAATIFLFIATLRLAKSSDALRNIADAEHKRRSAIFEVDVEEWWVEKRSFGRETQFFLVVEFDVLNSGYLAGAIREVGIIHPEKAKTISIMAPSQETSFNQRMIPSGGRERFKFEAVLDPTWVGKYLEIKVSPVLGHQDGRYSFGPLKDEPLFVADQTVTKSTRVISETSDSDY